MNSIHLYSILFILSNVYSFSESLNVKRNIRVRREEPKFLETKCILIYSVAKERCSTTTREDEGGRLIKTRSCVIDEKFRVQYKTQNGQKIISTIETYGQNFPRLMKEGDVDTCYYHPTNVRNVRWTREGENYLLGIIVMGVIFGIIVLIFVSVVIYSCCRDRF